MDKQDFEDFRRQFEDFPFRRVRNIVLGVLALGIVVAIPFTMIYQVEADEKGVILRFGKLRAEMTESGEVDARYAEPGLHWKLPFGIDRVVKVEAKRIKKEEFGFRTRFAGIKTEYERRGYDNESLMLTGDLNIADVEWIVQYRIKEPSDYLFAVRKPEETLRNVSEAAARLVVGDYSITDVLTEQRGAIEQEVGEKIQSVLDLYKSGIQVTTVKLQDVNPPENVKTAFDGVNAARLRKETTINQARQEYFQKIPEARGLAKKTVAEAEGYRAKRVNEAKGDVVKFEALLEEYQRASGVTRTRLYLEAMAGVLPQMSHLYIVDDEQRGPLQVLDLKQAAAGARRGDESSEKSGVDSSGTRSNRSRRNQ